MSVSAHPMPDQPSSPYNVGDVVRLRPEYIEPHEIVEGYLVLEVSDVRLLVMPLVSCAHWAIRPQYRYPVEFFES